MKRVGIFGVEMNSPRGAVQFVRTGEAVVRGGGVLWVTPQGRFADTRERPLEFKAGLAAVAVRVAEAEGECGVLPLAIEYPFWDERLPEVLLQFGERVRVMRGEDAEAVQARLVGALEAAMEELKAKAMARDAEAFERSWCGGRGGWAGSMRWGNGCKGVRAARSRIVQSIRGRRLPRCASDGDTFLWALRVAAMLGALTPAVLFCLNLRRYRVPAIAGDAALLAVSVLIPARDEAAGIEGAVGAALASVGVAFEVVVMDDGSSDGTGELVAAMAARDGRVRVERAPVLPAGWNGKQHALLGVGGRGAV